MLIHIYKYQGNLKCSNDDRKMYTSLLLLFYIMYIYRHKIKIKGFGNG